MKEMQDLMADKLSRVAQKTMIFLALKKIRPKLFEFMLEHSWRCPLLVLTTLMIQYGQKRGF
jgi:hypothetical protein